MSWLGTLCNWLVCLALWMAAGYRQARPQAIAVDSDTDIDIEAIGQEAT